MTDWIIRSKLAPSIRLQSLLERGDLVDRLEAVLDSRVAILHAPAGYGKTSLLSHWRHALSERGVPVAWLSVDDHDRDQIQFLTYLMEACKSGALMVSNSTLLAPSGGVSGSPPNAIIGAILTELSKCSGSTVFILDDFHRAETSDNCGIVNQLLESLPANVHLVISTREYPSELSLADLRAREELVEIDQFALQFSEQEIRTYLGALVETSEKGDWPGQLYARTEGWPIALKTVRRWFKEGASIQETLDQVSGRSSDLSDYFLEQVFDNLDEEERIFLLKTSILERVTGDLANKLCNTSRAWELLEELERRDLFVQSLDRERTWYRYHRLFSEFLQERLRRRFIGLSTDLHRIASEWFREKGHLAEAVQHALESRQSDVIADLFEHLGGWQYALQGHVGALERALSLVDENLLRSYPRFRLGKVLLTARRGDTGQAEAIFNDLSAEAERGSLGGPRFRSELLIMRSLLNVYADNSISDDEIDGLERLSDSIPHERHAMHAARFNLVCAMYAQRGNFHACVTAGDKAIRHYRAMGSVWGETFIYFHEGYACMAQGRLRDAEVLYCAGHDIALENFGDESDLAAIASALLAEAAYEKNNVHEATQLLAVALPHIERFDAWLEVYIAAYTTGIKLARASSDDEKLAEVVHRARSTAANRGLPRLRAIADMQALEIRLRDEPLGGEQFTEDRINRLLHNTSDHAALRQLRVSVEARTLLKNGNGDEAAALLRDECENSHDRGLIRSFTHFSVLLATVLWESGQHDEAVRAFEAALSPSLFEGTKRVFIDEGDSLVHVIRDLARASEEKRGNRLRDRFLAELMMEINAADVQPRSSQDMLSPRELEVLRYLVQGRSNREIAQAVAISINTVKFHVKNVFQKLRVNTRKDAVSASIRRGIS